WKPSARALPSNGWPTTHGSPASSSSRIWSRVWVSPRPKSAFRDVTLHGTTITSISRFDRQTFRLHRCAYLPVGDWVSILCPTERPPMSKSIRIDLFTDVVCPWCLIGTARLDQALATLPDDVAVEVLHHPFLLDPTTPEEGQNTRERLAAKYGGDIDAMQ